MRKVFVCMAVCLLSLMNCVSAELPALHVEGKCFVNSLGDTVVLRGVSLNAPGCQKLGGHWTQEYFDMAAEWGANVMRIPIYPGEMRDFGWDYYLEIIDDGIMMCREAGLYVILDWHIIGNLRTGIMASDAYSAETTIEETKRFWNTAAARYKGNSTVAMFELFNEPTTGDAGELGECTWHQWRELMEEIIDGIRAEDPERICLVGGLDWSYDLSEIGGDPVQRPNMAYSCHPYPQKEKMPWPENWERKFGYLADSYPVVCTEVGWARKGEPGCCNPCITDAPYGRILTDYLDSKGMSFTAWCFDPGSGPILIEDWNYTPSRSGRFFKEYLSRFKK